MSPFSDSNTLALFFSSMRAKPLYPSFAITPMSSRPFVSSYMLARRVSTKPSALLSWLSGLAAISAFSRLTTSLASFWPKAGLPALALSLRRRPPHTLLLRLLASISTGAPRKGDALLKPVPFSLSSASRTSPSRETFLFSRNTSAI